MNFQNGNHYQLIKYSFFCGWHIWRVRKSVLNHIDIIKQINQFSYYTYRNQIHDFRSVLNGLNGICEIIQFQRHPLTCMEDEDIIENIEGSIEKSVEASVKKNYENYEKEKEIDVLMCQHHKLIQDYINKIQQQVNQYEIKHSRSFNLKELLMFYLADQLDEVIIDGKLDAKFVNAFHVVKKIKQIIGNHREIVVQLNDHTIQIVTEQGDLITATNI